MGLLDNIFDKDKDAEKKKADFSDVVAGGSSTAPPADKSAAPAQAAPNVADVEKTYTVVAGDTLSKIAKREYGDANAWPRIFEANKDLLKDPNKIFPGQKLKIPPK